MKRSRIQPGAKSLERGSTFDKRGSALTARAAGTKRKPIGPASVEQRAKVRGAACVRCGGRPVHPAHVIDRAFGGDDDARAVVPLCFECHRAYDTGAVSILEHLEPDHRAELAYAVQVVGLITALERITNERWRPSKDAHDGA